MPKISDSVVQTLPTPTVSNEQELKSLDIEENVSEFFLSVKKDKDAASALASKLSPAVVNKFINIINECHGTLLTSGIGKYFIIIVH